MIDLQKRIQRAAESILENEALTADLDDEAAKALLDWGVSWAERIASETAELDDEAAEEAMYQPMRSLRKMLRAANKWVADPQSEELERITEHVASVFASKEQPTTFPDSLPEDASTRVQALRRFFEGERRDPPQAV